MSWLAAGLNDQIISVTISVMGLRVMQATATAALDALPADLSEHLAACGAGGKLIFTRWLQAAFTADFPLNFAARLLDVVMAHGWRAPLAATAATLLATGRESLLLESSLAGIVTIRVRPDPCRCCGT
jgi:Rab-GTPase-TBC domain